MCNAESNAQEDLHSIIYVCIYLSGIYLMYEEY